MPATSALYDVNQQGPTGARKHPGTSFFQNPYLQVVFFFLFSLFFQMSFPVTFQWLTVLKIQDNILPSQPSRWNVIKICCFKKIAYFSEFCSCTSNEVFFSFFFFLGVIIAFPGSRCFASCPFWNLTQLYAWSPSFSDTCWLYKALHQRVWALKHFGSSSTFS